MSKFPSNGRDELFAGNQSSSNKRGGETVDPSQQLLRARNELQVELERMKSTAAVVATTSSTISSISSQYSTYKARIASAGRTLKQLRSKLENDERYIYWSYLIFVASAMWIFLKRVKLVAISQWLISRGYTGFGLLSDTISDFSSVATVVTTHKPGEPATSTQPSTTMTTLAADYVAATARKPSEPATSTQYSTTMTTIAADYVAATARKPSEPSTTMTTIAVDYVAATAHKPSEPATSTQRSTTMTTLAADYVAATAHKPSQHATSTQPSTITTQVAAIEGSATTTQFQTTETYRTTTPGVVDKEL